MPIRTALFVDYQNAYRGAREAFHAPDDPSNLGGFDPIRVGHLLVGRSLNRELSQVRIYRGRPSRDRDPIGHGVNRRQAAVWEARGATVVSRILRYPGGWPAAPAMEKGIDVALAVDFVVMALLGRYDVGVLMSTDSDLEPALEAVCALASGPFPRCEVAAWSNPARRNSQRLSITGRRLWCHWLGPDDYKVVADPTDYRRPRRVRGR